MTKKEILISQLIVIDRLLTTYEAEINNRYGRTEYTVNTRYGKLSVVLHKAEAGAVASIFTRFETPTEEAQYFTGCGHTGKMNFHEWSTEALLNQFFSFMENVYEPKRQLV